MSANPTFPMNAWYAAAWETDVSRDLFSRRICGIAMVFYRKFDRSVVALRDACWHRLVPLSEGRLVGDDLMCGYHGLIFNPQGRCIHMPSQETINPSASVRAFPIAEKHRLIWVWPGDPALADPATIPDLHWLDTPGWAAHQDYQNAKCDYRLLVDNLMDLTHETFLHGNSIGQAAVAEAPFEVVHGNGRVQMTRRMDGVDAPPFFAMQHRMAYGEAPAGKMNRWQEINFTAPCTISISVGVKPAEPLPDGVRGGAIHGQVLNSITPESEGSCHYFFSYARSFSPERRDITEELHKVAARILVDDYRIVEKQQCALDEAGRDAIYNLNIDAGALWARRYIDAMISDEQPMKQLHAV